jgi:hypothetical protein
MARKKKPAEEYVVIYTPYITRPNGKRDWASAHGKKAWQLRIPKSKLRKGR